MPLLCLRPLRYNGKVFFKMLISPELRILCAAHVVTRIVTLFFISFDPILLRSPYSVFTLPSFTLYTISDPDRGVAGIRDFMVFIDVPSSQEYGRVSTDNAKKQIARDDLRALTNGSLSYW